MDESLTPVVNVAFSSDNVTRYFGSSGYFRRGKNIALSADNLIVIWHNLLKTLQKVMTRDARQVKLALWKARVCTSL